MWCNGMYLSKKRSIICLSQNALIVEENQSFDTSLVAIGNEKNVFDLVQVL